MTREMRKKINVGEQRSEAGEEIVPSCSGMESLKYQLKLMKTDPLTNYNFHISRVSGGGRGFQPVSFYRCTISLECCNYCDLGLVF